MIINQKKVAQVILAKRDEKGKESSAPMASEESQDPRHAIAEDLILAVKNGSAQGVLQALDALDAMADADEGEESPSVE
jgi:hypothetical protein